MANIDAKIIAYVGRDVDFRKEVIVWDMGKGPFIKSWEIKDIQEPTMEELASYEDEGNKIEDERVINIKRKAAYGSATDQLDMMFWDKEKGTTTWQEHIRGIKKKYPKVK